MSSRAFTHQNGQTFVSCPECGQLINIDYTWPKATVVNKWVTIRMKALCPDCGEVELHETPADFLRLENER